MWTAILSAIASTLGFQLVNDASQFFGNEAAKKWRQEINEIQNIIAKNGQFLSDWKTANETQKAGLINSLLSSSGLGARAANLKKMYDKAVQKDKAKTEEVTKANKELSDKSVRAENELNQAVSSGLVGAVKSWMTPITEKGDDTKSRNDLTQNVTAGLQGKENTNV